VLWLRLDGLLSWAQSGAMRELGHIRSYEDLVAALRGRCDELDISFRTLDEVAGLADGYSAKLLAPGSSLVMGRGSFAAVLGALGLVLTVGGGRGGAGACAVAAAEAQAEWSAPGVDGAG
jgi:hypothetical protein